MTRSRRAVRHSLARGFVATSTRCESRWTSTRRGLGDPGPVRPVDRSHGVCAMRPSSARRRSGPVFPTPRERCRDVMLWSAPDRAAARRSAIPPSLDPPTQGSESPCNPKGLPWAAPPDRWFDAGLSLCVTPVTHESRAVTGGAGKEPIRAVDAGHEAAAALNRHQLQRTWAVSLHTSMVEWSPSRSTDS